MTFFVKWGESKECEYSEEFETEKDLLQFLEDREPNPDFWFEVVEGRRVKFESVEAVVKYRRAKS